MRASTNQHRTGRERCALPSGPAKRLLGFLGSDAGLMLLLWLAVIAERLLFTAMDRTEYSMIVSDSSFYYQSGLDLIRTGQLIYRGYPTALIMPGISVLIGLLSLVFPEGLPLMYAIRFLWILMGSLVPLFLYRSIRLFAPKGCALLGSTVYLMPWHVQIDCFLLTECPYYLFFAMAFFYMLKMGEDARPRWTLFYALSVFGALMFRANILIFTAFTLLYLLVFKPRFRALLPRRALTVFLVLALFMVPWSIRNYRLYHAFIPVTYGAGNPLWEGTYQGEDPPSDEEIAALGEDFDAVAVLAEKRPDLLDAQGRVHDVRTTQYVEILINREIGLYRLRTWWRLRPLGLLKSYLYVKPRSILNWVWYYIELPVISIAAAHRLRQLGFLFCALSFVLSFVLKKHRGPIVFLTAAYFINLLLLGTSYAIDRYAQMIMPYRYLLMGLGLELLWEALRRLRRRKFS